MKKLISVLLFISFIVFPVACNSEPNGISTTDSVFSSSDSQESDISYQMNANIAESADSFYYIRDNFLYVIDKKSHKCMPLCSRPDCLHDQGNDSYKGGCDAYFLFSDVIVNYLDELYYIDEEWYTDSNGVNVDVNKICKMKLDGTDRQDVFKTENMMMWRFKIHRGYIYFQASEYADDGSASSDDAEIYRIPVSGKGEPEKAVDLSQDKLNISDVRFGGDNMFVLAEKFISVEKQEHIFLKYDVNTGESENLNEKLNVPVEGLFTLFNGKVVYSHDSIICECDYDGENERQVADCREFADGFDWYTPVTNDGERLLIDASKNGENMGDRTWLVLDKNYNHIITYTPPINTMYVNFCNSENMILKEFMGNHLYFIDKSKLGSGDCMEEIYTFKDN